MSLSLMKERMSQSGLTPREEMLRDAQYIEIVENENDVSYCSTFYKVVNQNDYSDENSFVQIHPRLYSRKWALHKNHEVKMKTLISEPVKYGDLFHNTADNTWWLCMQVDCVDDVDYVSKLVECNYLMYWQLDNGDIVSRYCHVFNASSYSNGEDENKVLTLKSNQFMVYMTFDALTDTLENGKRIHISHSNTRCKAYELTRVEDITFGFGGFGYDGVLSLIFTQYEENSAKDRLVTLLDGTEVWICDYFTPNTHEPVDKNDILLQINGRPDLRLGSRRTYTITCTDENGNTVATPADFAWNVVCDFDDVLEVTIDGDTITLFIDDDDYADEKFKLQALIGSVVKDEIVITVTEIWG